MRRAVPLSLLSLLSALLASPAAAQAPLTHFHEALGEGRARVFVYGASHTAAGTYVEVLRAGLQARFGDGGPGWIVPSSPFPFYAPQRVTIGGGGWRGLARRFGRRVPGPLGLAGIALDATGYAHATVVAERSFDEVSIHFHRRDGAAPLQVRVGDETWTVETARRPGQPSAGVFRFTLPAPAHRVALITDGPARVFGLALDRQAGGITVDNFGVPGARFSDQARWDESALSGALVMRPPDLVVFAYGTNESSNHRVTLEAYRARLRAGLRAWRRRAPDASCLLMGPADWPREDRHGGLGPRPRLTSIVAIQAEEARRARCAFLDTFARMGGEGSMARWVARGWGSLDHVHFTDEGYRRIGAWLLEAVLPPEPDSVPEAVSVPQE
ncbi:MAG: GDSL-type esterase/lipase family protein [Sandaracinaceae bacterium]